MKFKLLSLTSLLVICTLILPSGMWLIQAKSDANGTKAQAASETYQIYLPIVEVDLPPVIPDTTVALSDKSTDQLTISPDGAIFTFTTETSELGTVDEGDVIVGDVSDAAPEGFLRKVTSKDEQDGNVVLVTEEATLEDSIQDGAIHTLQNLNPEEVTSEILQPGVTILADSSCEGFGYSLDTELYSNGSGGVVEAKGDICFSTNFYFDLSIKNFELKRLTFTNITTQTSKLEITSNIEFSGDKEVKIANKIFKPKTFWIGWVPVVITPELIVYVGIDGSVTAGISTSISQEAVLTAGLKYASDTGWDTVWDFTNNFYPPTNEPPSINMSLKAYAGIKLRLRLYGAAGPYVKVQVNLELCVDTIKNPWWTLDAGLEVAAGFDMLIIGDILSFDELIFDHSWRLMPPHEPENPLPESPANNVSTDVILSWESPDTSLWNYLGPDVIFEVYLEAENQLPDVLVSSGTELFYAPSIGLDSYTQYYWRVEAIGNFGTTTVGPVWNFKTEPSNMIVMGPNSISEKLGCDIEEDYPFDCSLWEWELPLHFVRLDPFYIAQYEVTNAQYAQCVTAGACSIPHSNSSFTRDYYYGNSDYANYPVVNVDWTQAEAYCTWNGFRLPTEAEWELAAVYNMYGPFPWGSSLPDGCDRANYILCLGDTLPVGSFPSGESYKGLMDMAGNVSEWVSDWFSPTYYFDLVTQYPDGIFNPPGPDSGSYKVIRGGNFNDPIEHLRTAYRDYSDTPSYDIGFRCAKSYP